MKIIEILNNHGMITIGYDYNDICMMRLWGVIILKQSEIVVWAFIAWEKERLNEEKGLKHKISLIVL
ncbi:MAG: hypothetical protein H6Q69_1122 [Firmicutes bacterium]|nr:hypothetical protein [Bacillota bacterium]